MIAGEEEERDRTVSNEEVEAAEQAFTDGSTPSSIVAEAIRKFLIKLYKGNFLQYSELKLENRREERHAYFDLFKSFVQHEPCADAKIQNLFHKARGKRISDIFGKIRKKGENRNGWVKRFMRIFLMGGKRKNSKREAKSQAIEMARAKASRAREKAALANARADEANANAREAMVEIAELKRKFKEFQKQVFAWQSGQTGTSTVPSSVHPSAGDHYDDDSDG
ncbi:hypothetical protein RYX36_033245 [Vicia faba]